MEPLAELTIEQAGVAASVAPARGAIVTALRVAGRDVLFMDRGTLLDPAKSVRGGIPILFPFAGRLANDTLLHAGTTLKQHGFARNRPWTVIERTPTSLRCALDDDAASRAAFP